MVIGSFAVVSLVGGKGEAHNDLASYRGLSTRRPALAGLFTVFLLAQAGVPFTSGFLAKFYVVSAAVDRGQYALAVIAMIAAAIAAFFYLRLAIVMYGSPADAAALGSAMGPSAASSSSSSAWSSGGGVAVATVEAEVETSRIAIPVGIGIALVLCAVFTIGVGLAPAPVIDLAKRATLLILMHLM